MNIKKIYSRKKRRWTKLLFNNINCKTGNLENEKEVLKRYTLNKVTFNVCVLKNIY